jgi:DHA2 family multidrug resistance protein
VNTAVTQRAVNKWWVAATVMLPTAMEILDTSVANVALPHIRGALSASVDEVTWVLTSYLVANAVVLPMTGWLAATFGRKRFLIGCVLGFTTASFLCGSAPTLTFLITVRVLQGFFGGALQPMSQAILLETFPREEHGMAMGVFGMGIVAAPVLGPVLGGYITDHLSWRWIFYINIPVGLVSVLATFAVISDPEYLKTQRRRIDLLGMGLLTVGIGALQIMLDKGNREDWFSSRFIMICAACALIGLVALVWWEVYGTDHPLVDLRVFLTRSFGLGCLVMFLVFASFFASIVLLPLYLQELMGYTAYDAGVILGPGGAITMVAMPIVGKLSQRGQARRLLVVGLTITAASLYLMSRFTLQADFWAVLKPRLWQGLGISMFFVPLTTLTVADVPRAQMGNATGLFNLVRNVGGAIGVSIVSTMLTRDAQRFQFRIAERLDAFDPNTAAILADLDHLLVLRGIGSPGEGHPSLPALYGQIVRDALMLAFNHTFFVLFVAVLVVSPAVFLFKRPARPRGSPAPVEL